MTCEHKNTTVVNSRPPGIIASSGKPHFKQPDFPCLVWRRRKCNDCGERFTTVEVLLEYMRENTSPEIVRKEVIGEIKELLSDFLEEKLVYDPR